MAATCFLVSQFLLEQDARRELFRSIAGRLRPGAILASSDLASELGSREYEALLGAWLEMMAASGIPRENLEQMRVTYEKDVAILPPHAVASIIESAGFEPPVQFYQAGLIHAWFAARGSSED